MSTKISILMGYYTSRLDHKSMTMLLTCVVNRPLHDLKYTTASKFKSTALL